MTVREIEAAYLSGKRLQTVMTSERIALRNFDVFKNRLVEQTARDRSLIARFSRGH
jgi:hypothetical protein